MSRCALFGALLFCAALSSAQVIPSPGNPASACTTTPSPCVTLTGSITGSNGIPAQNYSVTFKPSQALIVAGTGFVVPSASTCATSIDGTVVGVQNPLVAPTVTSNFVGTLSAGTYYVEVAYFDFNNLLTVVSPETVVQLTGTGGMTVQSPTTVLPYGVSGYKVYIGSTSGAETLQGSVTGTGAYSQTIPLVAGAAVPGTNGTLCQQVANDAAWPSGTGYNVALTDTNGNTMPGYPMQWQLMGPGSEINLSLGLPYYHGVVYYPTPILASPANHASQSVSGPLNLGIYPFVAGTATVQSAIADTLTVNKNAVVDTTVLMGGTKKLKVWRSTYGTFDTAAAASLNASGTAEPVTQVEGLTSPSQLSTYASRDSVALFVQNNAQPPLLSTANTLFTGTTVTSTDFASISSSAKTGMIIDVQGSPVISGIITAINGNIYTVSGWYKVDGSGNTQTPTAGSTAVVNPATSVWALNTLTSIAPGSYATKAVGAEYDLSLTKSGVGAASLGLSVVNTPGSTETGYAAVNTTGNWARGFVANQNGASSQMSYGFQATNCTITCLLSTQTGNVGTGITTQNGGVGYNSQGDTTGILIDAAGTNAITNRQAGVANFNVDKLGNMNLVQSITLSNSSTALTRYAKYTASITPSAVAANTAAEQSFTVTGVQAADIPLRVLPPSALTHLGITNIRVTGANTVAVQFQGDATGGTPPAGTYTFVVVQ